MQTLATKPADSARISFNTHPDRYAHWRMSVEGEIATTRSTASASNIRRCVAWS